MSHPMTKTIIEELSTLSKEGLPPDEITAMIANVLSHYKINGTIEHLGGDHFMLRVVIPKKLEHICFEIEV